MQGCIVLNQHTLVSTHCALKPMVLLQTTQRVNVDLHRALQIQVYIVTSRATNVLLFHHALKPMVLLQTAQRVFVALHHALHVQG